MHVTATLQARNTLGWGPFGPASEPLTLNPAPPMRPLAPVRMDFEPRCIELRWTAPKVGRVLGASLAPLDAVCAHAIRDHDPFAHAWACGASIDHK